MAHRSVNHPSLVYACPNPGLPIKVSWSMLLSPTFALKSL